MSFLQAHGEIRVRDVGPGLLLSEPLMEPDPSQQTRVCMMPLYNTPYHYNTLAVITIITYKLLLLIKMKLLLLLILVYDMMTREEAMI